MCVKGIFTFCTNMTCQNYFQHIADLCSKIIELYLYPEVKINVLETTQCLIKLRMMKSF